MSESTQTQNNQNQQPPVVVLYDADASQRVPFKAERGGRLFKVVHVIDAIQDEDIIEFERSKDVRLSDADSNETNDSDATAVSSKLFEPAINLWDKRSLSVEKYALKNPDGDWRKEIASGDKAFAINSMVLATQFVSLPVASGDEECPPDDDDTSTYILRAMFNGQVVETRHVLRRAKPDEMSEFQSLMGRVTLVQGTQFGATDQRIPSRVKRLGELYRQVKQEATGYIGRVPLHHQMALALRHFRAQHKFDSGNS
jgi:hypothetical protein